MASAASDRGLAPLNTQVLISGSARRCARAARPYELPRVLAVPVVRFLGSAVSCDTTPDHRRNGPLPASRLESKPMPPAQLTPIAHLASHVDPAGEPTRANVEGVIDNV